MKWSLFKRIYPNHAPERFLEINGEVRFIFNGANRDPFPNGKLKVIWNFPGPWPSENIRDFLGANIYKSGSSAYQREKNPEETNYHIFDIYITPTKKIQFKFRDIFSDSTMKFETGAEAKKWLDKPSLGYWAQALNFALWCATAGCGVSKQHFTDDQVGAFYKFHVIFTTRRILKQFQCPLPNDRLFKKYNNLFSKSAFERLKTEFKTGNDFRWRSSYNNGLGIVYSWGYRGLSSDKNDTYVPGKSETQLSDEWNSSNHQNHFQIAFVEDPKTKSQYEHFVPKKGNGLANLSRINQSIEAFVYCILGAQAQTRVSLADSSGGAKEAEDVFMKVFESMIVEDDISKSIQRYQYALKEAKQRLDLAVAYDCWLMPSDLVINKENIIGYNNKLQKAGEGVGIGINDINGEKIPVAAPTRPKKSETRHTAIIKPKDKTNNVVIRKKRTAASDVSHENNKIYIISAIGLFLVLYKL